jgi:hypothetical protein
MASSYWALLSNCSIFLFLRPVDQIKRALQGDLAQHPAAFVCPGYFPVLAVGSLFAAAQLDVLCQPQGFITRNVFVPVMAKETEPPVIHFVPDPSQRRLK